MPNHSKYTERKKKEKMMKKPKKKLVRNLFILFFLSGKVICLFSERKNRWKNGEKKTFKINSDWFDVTHNFCVNHTHARTQKRTYFKWLKTCSMHLVLWCEMAVNVSFSPFLSLLPSAYLSCTYCDSNLFLSPSQFSSSVQKFNELNEHTNQRIIGI